jgi:hypothetical protein
MPAIHDSCTFLKTTCKNRNPQFCDSHLSGKSGIPIFVSLQNHNIWDTISAIAEIGKIRIFDFCYSPKSVPIVATQRHQGQTSRGEQMKM